MYTSQSQLSPSIDVVPAGESLTFSWLVPSTSFVLQQSSDLNKTNWTVVPTTPTLNISNLQYQVKVAPSLGKSFYRLRLR